MRRSTATIGSTVFFAVAPGTVAGLLPWLLTKWHTQARWWLPVRGVGWLMLAAGVAVLVHAFVAFVVDGRGTPAPAAPPAQLVIGGAYRYVRNPMYVAVLATILGQGLSLGQPVLLWYAFLVAVTMAAFTRYYEEPTLQRRFGARYDAYRRHVPAWIPRLRPWRP
jgi:protein-S-isoprenylcysteine O-methyltransferase Ste14